jgi:hypothetical protein
MLCVALVIYCFFQEKTLGDISFKLETEIMNFIYPAMTAFTDQYSLPNIFFDIGQL